MPINSSISIRASVGRGGRNESTDVRAIQTRLNALMKPPRVPLTVDGRCGPKTEAMIADFQKVVLGTARPDGRVDPSGGTTRALNDTASEGKWAQMTMAPPATGGGGGGSAITYPPSISASERKAIDNLAAAARAESDKIYLQVLDKMIAAGAYGHFKNAMNVLGGGQYAAEFVNAIRGMRQFGFTAEDIVWVLQQFAVAKNGNGLAELLGIMKTRPTLGASVGRLAKLGKAMNVVAVVFCVSEVTNHIDAGRYGAAAAEIYGTGMSMAVPWAGFIDAFQGVAFAYAPGLKTSPGAAMFFKILNSLNPVGMGKTGIDAIVTLVDAAFRGHREGKFPMSALEGFTNRARSSPMQPFVQFGEYLGDKAADRWGEAFYEKFLK